MDMLMSSLITALSSLVSLYSSNSTCQMVDMQAVAQTKMTRRQILIKGLVSGHKVANGLGVYC